MNLYAFPHLRGGNSGNGCIDRYKRFQFRQRAALRSAPTTNMLRHPCTLFLRLHVLFAAASTAAAAATSLGWLGTPTSFGVPAKRVANRPRVQQDETFIPASSPSGWFTGRTRINADVHGSRSFDWEGTSMSLSVSGASYVKIVVNATAGLVGRFATMVNGVETSTAWVG